MEIFGSPVSGCIWVVYLATHWCNIERGAKLHLNDKSVCCRSVCFLIKGFKEGQTF